MPDYNLAASVPPLQKEIKGPVPGDYGTYETDVTHLVAGDTVVQAQIMAKISPTTEDDDDSTAREWIVPTITLSGQITRPNDTSAHLFFILLPSFTSKFTTPRPYAIRLWVTNNNLTKHECIQVGTYTPNDAFTVSDNDLVDTIRLLTEEGSYLIAE